MSSHSSFSLALSDALLSLSSGGGVITPGKERPLPIFPVFALFACTAVVTCKNKQKTQIPCNTFKGTTAHLSIRHKPGPEWVHRGAASSSSTACKATFRTQNPQLQATKKPTAPRRTPAESGAQRKQNPPRTHTSTLKTSNSSSPNHNVPRMRSSPHSRSPRRLTSPSLSRNSFGIASYLRRPVLPKKHSRQAVWGRRWGGDDGGKAEICTAV